MLPGTNPRSYLDLKATTRGIHCSVNSLFEARCRKGKRERKGQKKRNGRNRNKLGEEGDMRRKEGEGKDKSKKGARWKEAKP
jgi:hypothetical protein